MSWIQKLYETYDNCQSLVGYSTGEAQRPLLPICHTTAQAHIEVVIDQEGSFKKARVIDGNDATTIIPCTEGSGSRSGRKPECHPLCDRLQYVAGDFEMHGGVVTDGFSKNPQEPYRDYVGVLTEWCESKFVHPKALAVLKYVQRKTLIRDLVTQRILFLGKEGRFLKKSDIKKSKRASDIFSVVGSQDNSFIRWDVQATGELETRVWRDSTLWESWIRYYFSTKRKEPLCYVKGEDDFLALQHPKYVRVKGDGAKLISSNDEKGFTFRGRFHTAKQACGVSFDVSQKAHNALTWLISRQGKVFFVKGDNGRREPSLTIVAWSDGGQAIPQPMEDPFDILMGLDDLPSDQRPLAATSQELAIKLSNKILGYKAELGETSGVGIMALDSASKGRLAITYYQELKGSDYLERIDKWHESCAWIHKYWYRETQDTETKKNRRKYFTFVGAPAPSDIAEAAYGQNVDDRLRKATVERILPCIIDGRQMPRDLVESAVRRASNRVGMENWEWEKTLSIACALYRKYHSKEGYSMALDPNRTTRDYLYGRLLAIADKLEGHALSKTGESRDTNAARYMQRFAERPCSTWRQIYLSLSPYMARLGGAKFYKDLVDEVICKFDPEDFNSSKPLSGEFLLGYHCQRAALWKKQEEAPEQQESLTTI